MKATFLYGKGDVRVNEIEQAKIKKSTDAVIRTVVACVCGSDLWDYLSKDPSEVGIPKGHEVIGIVEQIGNDVSHIKVGDLVVAPFVASCGFCDFCKNGQQTSCRNIEFFGHGGGGACQAEFVRIPWADGTLVKLPVNEDSELLPSLLSLSDVLCTGYHAAISAKVQPGDTVAVIGDGAVGLSAVIGAKRLGASRIILGSRHANRSQLGREYGADEIVAERGEEGIAKFKELTNGDGAHKVLECVGTQDAIDLSIAITRDYGVIGRVGAAQYSNVPLGFGTIMRNIGVYGGVAPARAYIETLMPDILQGKINPGKMFDITVAIDDIATGYKAMAERTAIKALVKF
jgi:threonine dehydrogenase-like Zn-dependent dehydrogenase